ncbi:hypothetical protein [Moorena producens]|uniref:hypothetical protein n=1 Tax=Moorena producens TaxID=1155739 RepID=UPI003C7557AA
MEKLAGIIKHGTIISNGQSQGFCWIPTPDSRLPTPDSLLPTPSNPDYSTAS